MTAIRRRFSQEFKDELFLEVTSTSKSIKEVAVAFDVADETELTLTERARLKELVHQIMGDEYRMLTHKGFKTLTLAVSGIASFSVDIARK